MVFDEDEFRYYSQHQHQYDQTTQYNNYYSSAYYANGFSPPPLQSLIIAIRRYLEQKVYEWPHFFSSVIISLLVVFLFRFFRNEGEYELRERRQYRFILPLSRWRDFFLYYVETILLSLSSLRLGFSSTSPHFQLSRGARTYEDNDGERGAQRRASLPPLRETTSAEQPSLDIHTFCTDAIEPAFLSEDEYPSGWLVYDPVFGVISKEALESWKKGRESTHEEEKKEATATN